MYSPLGINTAFHSDFCKKKEHDNTQKKTINIALNFDFALFCFLNSWWVCSFPMHGLPLCLWVVLENSSLIACAVITLSKNLGFSSICFKMSAQISWRFFFWSLVKNFETTCAQIFIICRLSGHYLPHCFFVNGHPLCYQSNTKPTIFSDNFFNFSDIVSGFWCGWASWTFIIFNISLAHSCKSGQAFRVGFGHKVDKSFGLNSDLRGTFCLRYTKI